MSDNFQQTVDLRDRLNRQKKPAVKKTYAAIENIYQEEKNGGAADTRQTISRPRPVGQKSGWFRIIVLLLGAVIVSGAVYFLFYKRPRTSAVDQKTVNWYAVKLVDGTIYYGQITDVAAEPVVLSNVYYDYDQAKLAGTDKEQTKTIEETGNIRLVKRGKETQGGDGKILAYHVNILVMEPLRNDSKILKAILEYEK